MKTGRDLLLVSLVGLLVLLVVFLIGWREEAAVGLAVLVILDLFVVLRGRQARSESDSRGNSDQVSPQDEGGSMNPDGPGITYEQAHAAYQSGQKLHLGGQIYLVRPVPRQQEDGVVLWVTDERTLGDHGLLLFPDGRVEVK